MQLLMLISPSANRVYADAAPGLAAAELAICAGLDDVATTTVGGVDYLRFEAEPGNELLQVLSAQSGLLAVFEVVGDDLLRPVAVPDTDWFDDDLVTIPKYSGKTNEQFTRLLLNVTLAAVDRPAGTDDDPWTVLDPLCGRGTTLSQVLLRGMNAAGVEGDVKSVEAMAAFHRTWLRRKRLKHSAEMTPVRRDGKSLGKRFDVTVGSDRRLGTKRRELTVFTGDTRKSKSLYGKKKFDAIVTDAPYGVVHGSQTDVRGTSGKRDRSAAGLLAEAVPVWASQLKPGGALGISWNTFGLAPEDLAEICAKAGLEPRTAGPWLHLAHRVDSSINRDVLVAVRPG